ncbi:MAG TPA: hypothetical protein VF974_01805 [Patescibacteria group bacterium]
MYRSAPTIKYIASYSIYPITTDTNTLIDHVNQHTKSFKQKPNNITVDAGNGSEQNYQWLEDKRIIAYIKYSQFDRVLQSDSSDVFAGRRFPRVLDNDRDC